MILLIILTILSGTFYNIYYGIIIEYLTCIFNKDAHSITFFRARKTLRLIAKSLINFKQINLFVHVKDSVLRWHLKQPKLFQKASCGKLNDMFLWAKACRSISKPLAMLWQEFESATFHWAVFIMASVHVHVCLTVCLCSYEHMFPPMQLPFCFCLCTSMKTLWTHFGGLTSFELFPLASNQ